MVYKSSWSLFAALMLVTACLLLVSCGAEAPYFEPGRITVESTPVGATIFINDENTGEITPHTFGDLDASIYVITALLDGYAPDPAVQTVTLKWADDLVAAFDMRPPRLSVLSEPAGATVLLDGVDSGQVTPATFFELPAGDINVSLALDTYHFFPSSFTATIPEDGGVVVEADDFLPRAKRTIMLEGFSNVDCNGCPEMAERVYALMSDPEFGTDRVLYAKFSRYYPDFTDPFWSSNFEENDARAFFYGGGGELTGIPTLFQDGVLQGSQGAPPDLVDDMKDAVRLALPIDPGFLIDVTADFSNPTVTGVVTLTALEDVNLTGHTLYAALVQKETEYEEIEYHWVFRDALDSPPALGAIGADDTDVQMITLSRGDWDLDQLAVVAFVQRDSDKSILQAGSTEVVAPTLKSGASAYPSHDNSSPGGIRP